jgi:hypothetical protein
MGSAGPVRVLLLLAGAGCVPPPLYVHDHANPRDSEAGGVAPLSECRHPVPRSSCPYLGASTSRPIHEHDH